MRDKKEFIGMNKSSVVSQLKTLKDALVHGAPHYDMFGFVEANKLAWIWRNLRNLGNTHFEYQSYDHTNNGIFCIPDDQEKTVIALLSDWASDTEESQLIADQCGRQHYSIHLGDTYYVGNEKEIAYNFSRKYGSWPYGTLGSFAMLGNHEMYSSGKIYFKHLLPFMGTYLNKNGTVKQNQKASYFCLENQYWRIVALDTGYYSLKGLLGIVPNENLELHDEQKKWLKNIVKIGSPIDKRGIIILSHHQCLSAFESEFVRPMQYISGLIGAGRKILWLCGHEHWCSVYGANPLPHGSTVYARCIGNSGMPVELDRKHHAKAPKKPDRNACENRNLVLYDNRLRERLNDRIQLGHNGYVFLELNSHELKIQYYDDNNRAKSSRKILEEIWQINLKNGEMQGVGISDLTQNDPYELCKFAPNIATAIQ